MPKAIREKDYASSKSECDIRYKICPHIHQGGWKGTICVSRMDIRLAPRDQYKDERDFILSAIHELLHSCAVRLKWAIPEDDVEDATQIVGGELYDALGLRVDDSKCIIPRE